MRYYKQIHILYLLLLLAFLYISYHYTTSLRSNKNHQVNLKISLVLIPNLVL